MKRNIIVANIAVAVLALALIVGYQVTSETATAAATPPSGGSGCEGDEKIEGDGATFTAPAGESITSVCIKAGRGVFTFTCGETDDCYDLAWIETSPGCCTVVTIGGGGTSRDCKSISHTAATFGGPACEPKPTPTPEPTPTPKPEQSLVG